MSRLVGRDGARFVGLYVLLLVRCAPSTSWAGALVWGLLLVYGLGNLQALLGYGVGLEQARASSGASNWSS